jgi:hypothetical protein
MLVQDANFQREVGENLSESARLSFILFQANERRAPNGVP